MKFMHSGQGRVSLNQPAPSPIWDIPLTIQDCWFPTSRLPAFFIVPNCFCLPAWLMSNCSPESLFAPNFPPLLAWSSPSACPCSPGPPQMLSPAGHFVVLNLCPQEGKIFDHMRIATLCIGVTVNLYISLLLDRTEAWYMGEASWFALKGVPDQVAGSIGVWDGLGKGPVLVFRLAMCPSDPSGVPGICVLFIFYNWNFVAWSGAMSPARSVAATISVGIYLSSIIETL